MINWSTIWELIKVNILYSNPQAVAAIKKKQAKTPHKKLSAYKSILRQQAISLVIMFGIYGLLMSSINYAHSPAYLSLQVASFSFIAILYFFISLFSVFYDSKDTKLYLPLPVQSAEIYLAKLIASQGTGLPFLSPILAYLTIAYWQTNHSFLAPIFAFVMFLILLITTNSISLIALFFIGKALARSPYKKIISSLLMFLGIFLGIIILLITQTMANISVSERGQILGFHIPYFRGFYDVYNNPFSIEALLNFWLGLVITGAMVLFIKQIILPNYINETLKMTANVITKRKPKKTTTENSLQQVLIRHHLSGLKDSTLLMQELLYPLLFSIMFAGPILNNDLSIQTVTNGYFGIAFLCGFMIGMFISSPVSFLGVGMSLERENYYFMKSLPVNFRQFTIQKFWVLGIVQLIFPLTIYTILAIFLKVKLLLILSLIIGMFGSSFIFGEWVYARDHKLLMTNWQNINQLFYRGGGQWLIAGLQFLVMLLGGITLAVSMIASTMISPYLVSGILIFVLTSILIIIHMWIFKTFWKKLP